MRQKIYFGFLFILSLICSKTGKHRNKKKTYKHMVLYENLSTKCGFHNDDRYGWPESLTRNAEKTRFVHTNYRWNINFAEFRAKILRKRETRILKCEDERRRSERRNSELADNMNVFSFITWVCVRNGTIEIMVWTVPVTSY